MLAWHTIAKLFGHCTWRLGAGPGEDCLMKLELLMSSWLRTVVGRSLWSRGWSCQVCHNRMANRDGPWVMVVSVRIKLEVCSSSAIAAMNSIQGSLTASVKCRISPAAACGMFIDNPKF